MIGSWKDCLFGGDGWRRRSRCASVVQELLNDHRYTSRSRLSPQTRIKQNQAFRFMRRSLFSAHLQQLVTTNQMLQHQDCMWSRAETDQLSQNMLSEPSTQFWTTHWLMRTTGYSYCDHFVLWSWFNRFHPCDIFSESFLSLSVACSCVHFTSCCNAERFCVFVVTKIRYRLILIDIKKLRITRAERSKVSFRSYLICQLPVIRWSVSDWSSPSLWFCSVFCTCGLWRSTIPTPSSSSEATTSAGTSQSTSPSNRSVRSC